jgi:hypothetical protein
LDPAVCKLPEIFAVEGRAGFGGDGEFADQRSALATSVTMLSPRANQTCAPSKVTPWILSMPG